MRSSANSKTHHLATTHQHPVHHQHHVCHQHAVDAQRTPPLYHHYVTSIIPLHHRRISRDIFCT